MRSFDIELVAVRKRNHLPHWVTRHAIHAITFTLYDAMPANRLLGIRNELDAMRRQLIAQRGEVSAADSAVITRRMIILQQTLLDEGHGSSFMQFAAIAELVAGALLHFDGVRYELYAWCVMPNHVHVIVAPKESESLDTLVHSWKGYSGRIANRLLHRSGMFWHADYFDRAIRSDEHLERAVAYVANNPSRAGLTSWPYAATYPERIAAA